jgi:predicted metalloprotease
VEGRLFRASFAALILACLLSAWAPFLAAASVSVNQSSGKAVVVTQVDDPAAAAAATAREFSRLEADRAFDELYERMHPDALAVAPRSAVVGWYEGFFAGIDIGELTVIDVVFEPWTWGVTGTVYDNAVTVRYSQPYTTAGVTEEVEGEVHLVPFGDEWGWFFGASRSFLDQQVALYGDDGSATLYSLSQETETEPPIARELLFPDPLHAHVDQFWAARFQEAGLPYDPPNGVVAFAEPIVTACGSADPDREAAFYCVIDEKIYYSSEFRILIESQIGDFAWIVVVAHEWAHHIQTHLGFDLGVVPDSAGEVPPIELEQQADCLAGAYAIDAELTGWLDPGDIDEALFMTRISGDPTGTAWNDPRAHGTGDERIDAFLTGYAGGLPACDLDLTAGAGVAE